MKVCFTSLHGFHGIFNLEDMPIGAGAWLATPPKAGALGLRFIPEYWDELAWPILGEHRSKGSWPTGELAGLPERALS